MKSTFNYTSRKKKYLLKRLQILWCFAIVSLALSFIPSDILAQTTPPAHPVCIGANNRPDPPHCTSKDLEVVQAFLTSTTCYCPEGGEVTANLNFRLYNKTGSTRTSFAVFAILEKYENGVVVESEYFKECTGPVSPSEFSTITFPGTITYECGQSLKLTNVYLAWTDASTGDNRLCEGEDGLKNNFCDIDPKCGKPSDIVITPLLTASVTDTDGTCEGETDGSLTITASGGVAPYDFSLSPGGATVTNDADGVYTFTGLAADDYTITVEDAEGCEITVQGTVSEFPNPDQPTIRVTQPSCTVPTGKIEITSSTTGLQFSLDGGTFGGYPAGGYTVAAGDSYTLVARNTNGCLSEPLNIVINDAPIVPAGITYDVDQPTCENPTGRIEFLTPLGEDYSYSINGGTSYQDSPIFPNVEPATYNLRVRSDDGCVTAAGQVTINDAPIVPAGISLDVDQPSCTVLTGRIEFLTPLGDYEYSINGGTSYQESPIFPNLAPATYNLRVRSGNGCVTSGGQVTINDAPIVPSGITVDVTQPSCPVPTGTIEFTAPLGDDYSYSIDGGANYQDSPIFPGLAPGSTHNLRVRSDDGCITAGSQITLNNVPASPSVLVTAAPSTCVNNEPTVLITAAASGGSGTGYVYDWTVPQGATDPGNVASFNATVAGTYSVVVTDSRECSGSGNVVPVFTPCEMLEGCTPGYWKQSQHFGNWGCGYTTETEFFDVFGDIEYYRGLDEDMTLLEALEQKGGKFQALARHAAAAILNSCADVNYKFSEEDILNMVTIAFNSGNWSTAHNKLAAANEMGCPLGRAELSATSTSALEGIKSDKLTAYPTPFSDKAKIEFTTSRTENFVVNLYDMKGGLVKQLKAGTAKAGELQVVEVDGTGLNEGLYIARMISDTGARSVKLLLKRE